jgi:DNA (cytosine-5)-methyltransferase 1
MSETALQLSTDAPSGSWRAFEARADSLTQELSVGASISQRSIRGVVSDDHLGDWWRAYLEGRPLDPVEAKPAIRTVDLFSGSGGLTLGFSRACAELGFRHESKAAADLDAGAMEVFSANHKPEVTATCSVSSIVDYQIRETRDGPVFLSDPAILRDDWQSLVGQVDAVLAGPPCQGHSNLNNRSRRSDPRNKLYLAVPAFAIAVEAPVVVIENVPDVVHDTFGVVDAAIALLRTHGYNVTRGEIAAHEMGWAQTRRRFFIVARRDEAPLELGAVATGLRDDPRPILWALDSLPPDDDMPFMRDAPVLSDENRRRIEWLFENEAYDLALSERPDCHKDGTTYKGVYGRMHPDKPAPTLTTGFLTPGRGRFVHPLEPRVLTPREAARLQGFPDSYDFGRARVVGPAKKELTKWIGDAVPMPLGFAAGLAALGTNAASSV